MLYSRVGRFASLAARGAARAPARPQQRRAMAGAAQPEWTGIDKTVRDALGNKDEHLVLAILGGYLGLYLLSKAFSGGKKEEAPAAVQASAHSAGSSGDVIPSADSPEFEKWIDAPGNLEKLVATWEK